MLSDCKLFFFVDTSSDFFKRKRTLSTRFRFHRLNFEYFAVVFFVWRFLCLTGFETKNLVNDCDLWEETVDTAGVFNTVGFAWEKNKRRKMCYSLHNFSFKQRIIADKERENNLPSGDVNSYDPTMSITLLFGLSSVGGASFKVPVSSRFWPSEVSYLIDDRKDPLVDSLHSLLHCTHKKLYPFSWMSLTNFKVSTGACGAAQAHATKRAKAICEIYSAHY